MFKFQYFLFRFFVYLHLRHALIKWQVKAGLFNMFFVFFFLFFTGGGGTGKLQKWKKIINIVSLLSHNDKHMEQPLH